MTCILCKHGTTAPGTATMNLGADQITVKYHGDDQTPLTLPSPPPGERIKGETPYSGPLPHRGRG